MKTKLKQFVALSMFLLWLSQAIFSPIGKKEPNPDSNPPQESNLSQESWEESIPPISVHSPRPGEGDKDRN